MSTSITTPQVTLIRRVFGPMLTEIAATDVREGTTQTISPGTAALEFEFTPADGPYQGQPLRGRIFCESPSRYSTETHRLVDDRWLGSAGPDDREGVITEVAERFAGTRQPPRRGDAPRLDPHADAADAWERWDDLGDRLERAVKALTTMAEDSGTPDERDRLQAKADAVQRSYTQWAEVSKHGGDDAPRPAQSLLWANLTEAKDGAKSTGERSGYALALDYMRPL